MRLVGLGRSHSRGFPLAPLVADAQQAAKVFRIGVLAYSPPTVPTGSQFRETLLQGLRELGYVEDQNVVPGKDALQRLHSGEHG
jgi:hypothetical protein